MPVEPSRELDERIELFKSDCFHSRLKTHKLKDVARLLGIFLNYRYRILFEFVGKGEVLFETRATIVFTNNLSWICGPHVERTE